MQRTKIKDGMEVQIKTNYYNTREAVIVTTDIDVAHRSHRAANGHSRYRFNGNWDQAIAVALKNEDGTWTPLVTVTRKVLGTVEAYRAEQKAESDARIEEQRVRSERADIAAAKRAARLRHNPAVVDALNEFVGAERAFSLSYNGQIVTNDSALVSALAKALDLEVT